MLRRTKEVLSVLLMLFGVAALLMLMTLLGGLFRVFGNVLFFYNLGH